MSSPSPSKKSNGSRRQRKRAKSSPSFGTIIPEKDTSRTLKRATSCSPSFPTVPVGQRPQENPNLVFENVNPSATQNTPPQSPHPSAPTPSNENVQVGQTDENTPIVGCATAAPSTRNQQASADSSAAKNEAPNQDDKVQRVQIEPERTGWARLYDLIRNFDEERVKDLKEDIDTLLVFAGLFSAVITAFFIESYKNLQQQPEDMTNDILRQMSKQLTSLSLNGNLINSTAPSFVPTPFMTARSMVLINTLWALSLVIALITASLGILVKQWLHELLSYETHDPKERLKLRFFREVGLERCKVFALASSLPLLLQLALVFFFAGFSVFLHGLNPIVGWVTTGVMIAWLAVFVFTTFAPAFSSQCPYKTPMLKFSLSKVRPVMHALEFWSVGIIMALFYLLSCWYEPITEGIDNLLRRWQAWYDYLATFEEHKVRVEESLDFPVVMCARCCREK